MIGQTDEVEGSRDVVVEVLVPVSPVIGDLVVEAQEGAAGALRGALRQVAAAIVPLTWDPTARFLHIGDPPRRQVPLAVVEIDGEHLAVLAAAVTPAARSKERGALERLCALLSVDPCATAELREAVLRQPKDGQLDEAGQRAYAPGVLPLAVTLGGYSMARYVVGGERLESKVTGRQVADRSGLLMAESWDLLVDGMIAGCTSRWDAARTRGRSGWISHGAAGTLEHFRDRQAAERPQVEAFLADPLCIALALVARDVKGVAGHQW